MASGWFVVRCQEAQRILLSIFMVDLNSRELCGIVSETLSEGVEMAEERTYMGIAIIGQQVILARAAAVGWAMRMNQASLCHLKHAAAHSTRKVAGLVDE